MTARAGTVVVAFVLGAFTGAAVALLMAPASGEETRRVLADKAREGRRACERAARQGREFVNRQKETLSTAIERGRKAYHRHAAATADPRRRAESSVNNGWSDLFLGVIAVATLFDGRDPGRRD